MGSGPKAPSIVGTHSELKAKQKTKLHGLSPRANYTDRATDSFRT
jgi:hypothetical protein